uniref:Uncharacterized protein n=1 Tax=Ixodes ricinus TaxID=34613 RepID=A0A090XBT7_IXORI
MDKLGRARDSKRHGTIVGPIGQGSVVPGCCQLPGSRPGSRCEWPAVLTLVDDDDGGRVRRHLRGSRAGGARDTWNIGRARLRWSGLC